jgi:hypothetical protein
MGMNAPYTKIAVTVPDSRVRAFPVASIPHPVPARRTRTGDYGGGEREAAMTEPDREEYETATASGPAAPEADAADAAEQSRPVDTETDAEPHVGPEVDEYDAVEQSRVVADDDEYRR